jgi:hypothetical protein
MAYWVTVCERALAATREWFKTNWLGATGVSLGVLVVGQLIAWRLLGPETVKGNLESLGTTLAGLVAASVLFFVVQLVRLPPILDEEREQAARRLRAEVATLQARIAPRLTVLFDQAVAECFDVVPIGRSEGRPTTRRLCRVGIRNESDAETIRSVRVRGCLMPAGALGRVPLRVMHDRANPPTTEFTLNPRETIFVDVAAQEHGFSREGSDRIVLSYTVDGIPNVLEPGRHIIEISVTAADTTPSERRFVLDVDGERRLLPLTPLEPRG